LTEQTEKILFQLELDVNALVGNTQKAKQTLTELKAESVTLNKSLDDLKKTGVTSGASFDNYTKQLIANKAAQQNTTTTIRDYEKQLRLAVAANDAQIGSIDQMKARLSILTAEWNALALAGRENTQEGKALAESIDLTTEELNKQEQSVGNFHRQVGNYAVATKSLRQEIKEAKDEATRLTREYGENSKQAEEATRKVANLTEQQEDFNKRVAAFNPEAKFAAFTQVAGSLAGGLSSAQSAMALLGIEGGSTQEILLKVQAASNFANGLNQLASFSDGFKNLKLVLGITTAAKKVDTAATEENAAASVTAAGATETFAAAEKTATVTTGGLSIAIKSLLIGSGLLLLPVLVSAAVDAFRALTGSKETVDQLTASVQSENDAHKQTLDQLKLKNDALISQAENALAVAQSEKRSAEDIVKLQKDVIDAKKKALQNELTENKIHFDDLLLEQKKANSKLRENLSADDLKKAQEHADNIEKELQANKNRSDEIFIQGKKLNNDLILIDNDLAEKRAVLAEQTTTARITLIKNDRAREIASEVESNNEKIRQLQKAEEENAGLIAATKAASAQKIKEINLKFDLEELQERNKLAILLTKEGSQQRLDAELNAAISEGDQLLKNDKLTAAQRELIQAETTNKINAIEKSKIQVAQEIADQEVDLQRRKQEAIFSIQQANTEGNPEQEFALRSQAIKEGLQAELDARENAADKEKEIAQNTISDARALAARIKEIDDTTAAEKNSALVRAGQATIEITKNRFQQEADIEALKLERRKSEIQEELALVEKGSQKEFELKKDLAQAEADLTKNSIDARLNFLREEFQSGVGLNEQQYQEYLLLLQKKKEADAAAGQERVAQQQQADEQIRDSAIQFFEGLVQLSIQADQRRAQSSIKRIDDQLSREIKALDEAQAKEEGTFVAKTATQKKYDALRENLQKQAAQKEREIKRDAAEKEKVAAIISATIASALGVVKASPVIPLMIAAGIAGALQIALIAAQPIPEFYFGGYTGDGDPREVSTALGRKPYTYHRREYVIDHETLQKPLVADFVHNVVEPTRRKSWPASVVTAGRFTGGFADASQVVNNITGGGVASEDVRAIAEASAKSVMDNFPKLIVHPEAMTEAQDIITKVESRANVFGS
jgi:hypothetical protein